MDVELKILKHLPRDAQKTVLLIDEYWGVCRDTDTVGEILLNKKKGGFTVYYLEKIDIPFRVIYGRKKLS